MAENETLVGEATRSNGQAVRVTEGEFNGKTFLGIRLWDKVNDQYRPTKSGISVEVGNKEDEMALRAACAALVAHVDAKYAKPARAQKGGKGAGKR